MDAPGPLPSGVPLLGLLAQRFDCGLDLSCLFPGSLGLCFDLGQPRILPRRLGQPMGLLVLLVVHRLSGGIEVFLRLTQLERCVLPGLCLDGPIDGDLRG